MMLLAHRFPDPQMNLTLELFLRMISDLLGHKLVSVVLHGSIAFDDLAPGYGDLDFLVVVDDDIPAAVCQQLIELRGPLRCGDYGIRAEMLEGAFLPRQMLNPANSGRAFWWGTSGERPWESNQLGWFVLRVIRRRGIVIWGEDVRHHIPAASHEDLINEARRACESIREHAQGGALHSVDWLLTLSRLLLWLREGRLSSKSEAADWGYLHARGSWRELLPRAKQIRLSPALADSPALGEWLDTLARPIMGACEELKRELVAQGFETVATAAKGRSTP